MKNNMRLYYTLALGQQIFIISWDCKHDDVLLKNLNHALGGMADKEDIEQAFERLMAMRDEADAQAVLLDTVVNLLFGMDPDQSPLIQTDDYQQNEG